MKICCALLLAAAAASGQCFKIGEINAEKPEGQLLQQIGQEQDQAKRLALMDKFVADYPKHEAAGWVWEQMQAAYVKANEHDKTLAVSEKLVALSDACPELAHQALKAAEAKKDADLVGKWAEITAGMAQKVMALPKPSDEDEAETWKARVDYARQVSTYTEYALYAAALQTPDPQKRIALVEALEKRNPKSEYLAQAYPVLFTAYRQVKAEDKALALAERVVAANPSDEDMLLVVAGKYLQEKKEPEKVHAYCQKAAEIAAAKPKPAGVADADWNRRKGLIVGAARFINGSLYYSEGKLAEADKELREALPHLEGNAAMKAEALYYLGFANYKMQKPQEAANYYKACGAIKSRFQAMANKNLAAIKSEYTGIR
ncbi:MAG: hypothetical protein ACE15B_13940 [Bryobacteraceae bacterium]